MTSDSLYLGWSSKALLQMTYLFDTLGYKTTKEGVEQFHDDLINHKIKSPKQRMIEYHQKKLEELNAITEWS